MDYDGTMKALPPQFQQNFKTLEARYAAKVLDEVDAADGTAVARYLICLKWVAGLGQSRDGFLRDPAAKNPSGMSAALTNRAATYNGLAAAAQSLQGPEALTVAGAELAGALRDMGEVDTRVVSDVRLSVMDKMRADREKAYQAAATRLNDAARALVEAASEFYAPGIVQTLLAAVE